jgi:Ribbon-helix-helix protein, copG family
MMLNHIMVMDAMRKIPTTLTLDPMLVHRLDQAAADRDRSRSWLAGRAIEEFLATNSAPCGLPASQTGPEPPDGVSPHSARAHDRNLSSAGAAHTPGGSRDRGRFSQEEVHMDDPVAATRLLHAQQVDRTLRHEALKREATANAQDAAYGRAADDLKALMKSND